MPCCPSCWQSSGASQTPRWLIPWSWLRPSSLAPRPMLKTTASDLSMHHLCTTYAPPYFSMARCDWERDFEDSEEEPPPPVTGPLSRRLSDSELSCCPTVELKYCALCFSHSCPLLQQPDHPTLTQVLYVTPSTGTLHLHQVLSFAVDALATPARSYPMPATHMLPGDIQRIGALQFSVFHQRQDPVSDVKQAGEPRTYLLTTSKGNETWLVLTAEEAQHRIEAMLSTFNCTARELRVPALVSARISSLWAGRGATFVDRVGLFAERVFRVFHGQHPTYNWGLFLSSFDGLQHVCIYPGSLRPGPFDVFLAYRLL